MKQPLPILALAATAAAFSTRYLSVTGFDAPGRPSQSRTASPSRSSRTPPKGGETLATGVKSAACETISGGGFRLVDGDKTADVIVGVGVSQTEYNRAGDFIVCDGAVNARVSGPADGDRIIDAKTFSARGERALGEVAATGKLRDALSKQVEDWVSETVTAKKLSIEAVSVAVEYTHLEASR